MAIYHFAAQIIGRSSGASSTSAVAYRFGITLTDERTGERHDYSRKKGVDSWQMMVPDHAPSWAQDPAKLWNEIEKKEVRKDAQLCREINVAIPHELTHDQKRTLVQDYVKQEMVSKGMCAAVAFHDFESGNPHAHIMLTLRAITPDGFGNKDRSWNDKTMLEGWRKGWSDHANQALKAAGHNIQISEKSLEAQRLEAMEAGDFEKAAQLDRPATKHEGKVATQARRRGRSTARTIKNDEIKLVANNRFNRHQIRVTQLQRQAEATISQPLNQEQIQGLHARVQVERQPLNAKRLRAAAIREIRSKRALKSVKSTTRAFIDKNVDEATRAEIMAAESNAEDTQNHIQKIIQQAQQMLTTGSGDPMQRHHARNLIDAHKGYEKAEKQHRHWKQQRSQLQDDYRELSAKAGSMPEPTKAQKAIQMLGITSKAQQEMQAVIDQLARIDKESEAAKMARVKASADKMLALSAREERYQKFMEAVRPKEKHSTIKSDCPKDKSPSHVKVECKGREPTITKRGPG